jgi:hypothetical protein
LDVVSVVLIVVLIFLQVIVLVVYYRKSRIGSTVLTRDYSTYSDGGDLERGGSLQRNQTVQRNPSQYVQEAHNHHHRNNNGSLRNDRYVDAVSRAVPHSVKTITDV